MKPIIAVDTKNALGEGPLWHPRKSEMWWVDIEEGKIHAWSETSGHRVVTQAPFRIGAYAFTASDDLILATARGIERWRADQERFETLHILCETPTTRFNDGRVDPMGRFWVGTMPMDEAHIGEGLGKLYRFDLDGTLHVMDTGIGLSNGLDWSDDGKTMLFTDSTQKTIYAYDFDMASGTISNKRVHIKTDPGNGTPDGLVYDAEGFIWSACWGANRILRYTPDGKLDRRIDLDAHCPTSMAFGGADLSTLYITSARMHLDGEQDEFGAGALMSLDVNVRGRPTNVFGVVTQS